MSSHSSFPSNAPLTSPPFSLATTIGFPPLILLYLLFPLYVLGFYLCLLVLVAILMFFYFYLWGLGF